mgnify:CR=1 FL=1
MPKKENVARVDPDFSADEILKDLFIAMGPVSPAKILKTLAKGQYWIIKELSGE